jgi:hypothetical protein
MSEIKFLREISQVWVETEETLAALDSHLPLEYMDILEDCYCRLFSTVMEKEFPLRPIEARDFRRQLQRHHDLTQLYQRKSSRLSGATHLLGQTERALKAFQRALDYNWTWAPYDQTLREKFLGALKVSHPKTMYIFCNCNIYITFFVSGA